jgi:hypothetical protein
MTRFLALCFMVPAGLAWQGFVISCGWAWFLVPMGARPVGTWHAAGLVVLARLAIGFTSDRRLDDIAKKVGVPDETFEGLIARSIAWAAIASALALMTLWAIHRVAS